MTSTKQTKRFHASLVILCLLALTVLRIGSGATQLRSDGGSRTVLVFVLVIAALLPLTAYFHQSGLVDRRESMLVLYWELLFALLLPYEALIAARLRMPLRDDVLASCDTLFRVHVPAIVCWTNAHPAVRAMMDASYRALQPLLILAVVIPVLRGKKGDAQRFLVGNIVAVLISMPLFAALPAVGPWTVFHFAARLQQQECEQLIHAIRLPGSYLYRFGSALPIISFPSFHVVWALLSAGALWSIKPARIPLFLLTTLIMLSTMTTGWHYFSDVLAGVAVALMAMVIARKLCEPEIAAKPRLPVRITAKEVSRLRATKAWAMLSMPR